MRISRRIPSPNRHAEGYIYRDIQLTFDPPNGRVFNFIQNRWVKIAFFIEITRDKEYNILINYVFVVFCDFLKILMKLKGNY